MNMNTIFDTLSIALEGQPVATVLAAAGWGLISIAFSPCHLSSVPLAIGFVGSREGTTQSPWALSAAFAASTLVALAVLAGVTLASGRIVGDLWGVGPWLAAAVLLVGGLMMLDAIPLPSGNLFHPERVPPGLAGAGLLGALIGISLGPCTFAFLAPVAAVGMRLSGGLGVVVLASFAVGNALATLVVGGLGVRVGKWIQSGAGATHLFKRGLGVALVILAVVQVAAIP